MDDLKLIKKHYGEKMSHLCRSLFPTVLETEGLLWELISNNFAYNRSLYTDITSNQLETEFRNYIFDMINTENKDELAISKTPKELLDEAGYNLYECHSEEEIQSFKKYYATDEELCTFNENRLKRCYVFFAVKKNVDKIKREDFDDPKRQDEYGTSVISIQFTRDDSNTLSIKNRYNHTVANPDATFSNNLDNITYELTKSFNKEYDLNINSGKLNNIEIPGYVKASDGKYYKYNYEINNIYYCPNNIIIDNFKVKKYDKSKYIIIDYFIIDLVNKTIKLYKDNLIDRLPDDIKNIKNIKVEKDKQTKNKKITFNDSIEIVVNRNNQIIKYKNDLIEKTGYFLNYNTTLKSLSMSNLKETDENFLYKNTDLEYINLPNLEYIDRYFLTSNKELKEISLPKVKYIGNSFLSFNKSLERINLPEVEYIDNSFLNNCTSIKEIDLPKLRIIKDYVLERANNIEKINLPKVVEIGNNFMLTNEKLESIELPEVIQIGNFFLEDNRVLKNISMPKVNTLGINCLTENRDLIELDLPEVEYIDRSFLRTNISLKRINLPKLKKLGERSFLMIDNLDYINIPNSDISNIQTESQISFKTL